MIRINPVIELRAQAAFRVKLEPYLDQMMNKKLSFMALAITFPHLAFSQALVSPQEASTTSPSLDLIKVFQGSPIIYTLLLTMSILSFILWLYSVMTLRSRELVPDSFMDEVRQQLREKRYEAALKTCQKDHHFASSILSCGLIAREHGPQVVMEAMQAEGRRCGTTLWQRLSLLNDIAMTAPMLGLLGTVLGMFYAFYDTGQTPESITNIFDGLGIAIGTTVAGLIVAILATLFHTTLKVRVVKLLNALEDRTLALGHLIDSKASSAEG